MNQKYIELNNIFFSYGNGDDILKDISFSVDKSEAVGIIGANGVGKSTLLRILVGLELNFRGEAIVNHVPVTKKTLSEIRSKIGYLFQDSDNQLFTQDVYHDAAFALRNYGLNEKLVEERVMEALDLIGITHLRDRKIYKMSGGEKKMASIATLLAMKPDILLLDEPTITLDPRNRRAFIQLLNRLDYIKIIATHDLDMVLETCSRVILLSKGCVVADAPTEKILFDKELLEAHGLELPLCLRGR
ncbi:energy-coupling factor ABC transporter ATP-binding protein [Lachnoclostridium phytofermentans]|uniref:ABC transporter related n=1 Tax=Lachnoclostridium phytofermentans (strain ATCC 700394 / DSM 18823 / ISDg) TaxID=357809 RepID=A9KJS4_LACP7|nr:ABC transporter ATP-binding protein [Lachnoclostridium phytofermentans]ABX41079.1 ABC transporter related [Lachnoclostridium phytofermentans ISDg]